MTAEELELEKAFLEATELPELLSEPYVGYQGYKTKKKAAKAEKKAHAAKAAKAARPAKTDNSGKINVKTKRIIIICCAALLLAAAIGGGFAYYMYITTDDGLVFANVYIDGINLGGKTPEEAQALLETQLASKYTHEMVITLPDGELTIPKETAKLTVDVASIVEDAYQYGREGSRYEQYKARNAAALTSYQLDLLDYLSMDTVAIRDALNEIDTQYNIELIQPSVTLVGTAPSLKNPDEAPQILTVTMGQQGVTLDTEALYEEILDAYRNASFRLEAQVIYTNPDVLDPQVIYDSYHVDPVNAEYDPATFDVISETYGYVFDLESLSAQLEAAEPNSVIEVPMSYVEPEDTAKELEAKLFRDQLGSCWTYASWSNEARNTNLNLACEAVNGVVIMPGEVFSYNDTLGKRTAEKGYQEADAYSGGKTVLSIGGGICQVSSAIYCSAVRADMEIVERYAHTYNVGYMEVGLDATVSWGSKDFKFRNNTDYPIKIVAEWDGGMVQIRIFGTDEKDYYVVVETEIVEKDEYTTSYKTYPASNSNGYYHGQILTAGHNGYKVNSYRVLYNKTTNEEISRSKEAYSSYRRCDEVVVQLDPPPADATEPDPTDLMGSSADEGF